MRTRVYVCFDADEDMSYYNTLKMWDKKNKIDFHFNNAHELNNIRIFDEKNIKRNLRDRLSKTKLMIVLVGEKTKKLYKYVRWEIEVAMDMDIPIIAVNLNNKNGIDEKRCPPIMKSKPIVHVPFNMEALSHSINNWPEYYKIAVSKKQENLYYKEFE